MRRQRERERGQEKTGGGLDIVDYFAPVNNETIVRRWELFLILDYVEKKHRRENRWWRVLWRFVTRHPFLRFDFYNLCRLELARREQEKAVQAKPN